MPDLVPRTFISHKFDTADTHPIHTSKLREKNKIYVSVMFIYSYWFQLSDGWGDYISKLFLESMFLIIQFVRSFQLFTDQNLSCPDVNLNCKFLLTLCLYTLDVQGAHVMSASSGPTTKGIQQLVGIKNNCHWLFYCISCTISNDCLDLTTQQNKPSADTTALTVGSAEHQLLMGLETVSCPFCSLVWWVRAMSGNQVTNCNARLFSKLTTWL